MGSVSYSGLSIEIDPTVSAQITALDLVNSTTLAGYLLLAGGSMTGGIVFDATGQQNINKGTFDNSLGGYNGISLTCAVGYELNWQGGHLTNWYSGAAQTIYIDSPIDITNAGGITFSDDTVQTTAAVAGVTVDKALANAIATHLWYTWDGYDYSINANANINPNFTSGTYSSTFTYGISDGTNFAAGFPSVANITILDSASYWYVSVNGILSDIDIHSP